jgi:hypothetical protein
MTGLPSETIVKEFPPDGGFALIPVVHKIIEALFETIEQVIPSITMFML